MKQAYEFCMHNNLSRNYSNFISTSRSHEINSSQGYSLLLYRKIAIFSWPFKLFFPNDQDWSFENVIKVSAMNVVVSFEMTHTLITTSTQRKVITIVCIEVKRFGRGTALLDYLHNSFRNLKQLYHHVRINSFFRIRTHQCLVQNNWKNQTLAS